MNNKKFTILNTASLAVFVNCFGKKFLSQYLTFFTLFLKLPTKTADNRVTICSVDLYSREKAEFFFQIKLWVFPGPSYRAETDSLKKKIV